MANLGRDLTILLHIKGYCKEVAETLDLINRDFKKFNESFIIKNSLCMDLLQIGELTNRISSEYLEQTKNEMNWNAIRGMRNRLAHEYLKINYDIVFDVSMNDIPILDTFITKEINKNFDLDLNKKNENEDNTTDEETDENEI